ncbi:hypothetical protein C4D60_Mb01t22790 [Musa balbisiana]|uniref:Uncharacterized protein n=1 Tax=Musa balbisiana TaxID=52838 RepID=A0A4S8JPJ1_MUSBA|nr:hypothetical protein C4D60_Mb01t22790 [Musa balbisiana]
MLIRAACSVSTPFRGVEVGTRPWDLRPGFSLQSRGIEIDSIGGSHIVLATSSMYRIQIRSILLLTTMLLD